MAYVCVTCVPFNSQHKCFSALDSTAWVSLRKAKQRLSALLITRPKDADLLPVHGQSRGSQRLAQHNSLWFDPTDKLHPDSKHSTAVFPSIFPFLRTRSAMLPHSMSPPPRSCVPAGWVWDRAAIPSCQGTLCDKAWQRPQKWHLPQWHRHSISLIC